MRDFEAEADAILSQRSFALFRLPCGKTPAMHDVTAFIVAGKSSRMGQNKAFLKVGKRNFIDHAILQAKVLESDIFIVGPKEAFGAYGRVIEDIYRGCGPLARIHAALRRAETELALMLPLDTPFVRREYLAALVDIAANNGK